MFSIFKLNASYVESDGLNLLIIKINIVYLALKLLYIFNHR